MIQLCLWTKIRIKQWVVLGGSAFLRTHVGFLCTNYASLLTRQDRNEVHLKRWFFLPKSASSVNRSQADLAKRKRNRRPYSFSCKIKLIVCIIRHELSVTIHEISISWTKMLDGDPFIKLSMNAYKYQKLWVWFESTHRFKYLLLISVTYFIIT